MEFCNCCILNKNDYVEIFKVFILVVMVTNFICKSKKLNHRDRNEPTHVRKIYLSHRYRPKAKAQGSMCNCTVSTAHTLVLDGTRRNLRHYPIIFLIRRVPCITNNIQTAQVSCIASLHQDNKRQKKYRNVCGFITKALEN